MPYAIVVNDLVMATDAYSRPLIEQGQHYAREYPDAAVFLGIVDADEMHREPLTVEQVRLLIQF